MWQWHSICYNMSLWSNYLYLYLFVWSWTWWIKRSMSLIRIRTSWMRWLLRLHLHQHQLKLHVLHHVIPDRKWLKRVRYYCSNPNAFASVNAITIADANAVISSLMFCIISFPIEVTNAMHTHLQLHPCVFQALSTYGTTGQHHDRGHHHFRKKGTFYIIIDHYIILCLITFFGVYHIFQRNVYTP